MVALYLKHNLPDLHVDFSSQWKPAILDQFRSASVTGNEEGNGRPSFGLDLLGNMSHLAIMEGRYKGSRIPRALSYTPNDEETNSLMRLIVPRSAYHVAALQEFETSFRPDVLDVGVSRCTHVLSLEHLNFAGVSRLAMSWPPASDPPVVAYIHDPLSTADLIEAWNLRAYGFDLRLVALRDDWEDTISVLRSLAQRDPSIRIVASSRVLRSRAEPRFEELVAAAAVGRSLGVPHLPWEPYPYRFFTGERIWPYTTIDHFHLARDPNRPYVPLPDLDFPQGPRKWGQAQIMVEFKFTTHGGFDDCSVVPFELPDVHQLFRTTNPTMTWSTPSGIAVGCDINDREVWMNLPSATKIVAAALGARGISTGPTAAGRLARRLIAAVPSPAVAHCFSFKEVLNRLEEMASGRKDGLDLSGNRQAGTPDLGKAMPVERWRQLDKTLEEESGWVGQGPLAQLLEIGVFELGAAMQCPECMRHPWVSVEKLAHVMECSYCLAKLPFPLANPRSAIWSYRVKGPHSVPKYVEGAYTSLLLPRFMQFQLNMKTSVALGLLCDGREADVIGFTQKSAWDSGELVEFFFAECKSFNEFKRDDMQGMAKLGKALPDALPVVVTLKDSFTEGEKHLLRQFNRRLVGRLADRGSVGVCVLTGNELLSRLYLYEQYKKLGGRHAEYANRHVYDWGDVIPMTWNLYIDATSSPSAPEHYYFSPSKKKR